MEKIKGAGPWIKCSWVDLQPFASEMMKSVSSGMQDVELIIRVSGLHVLSSSLIGGMELVPCTACNTFPL